MQLDYVMKTTKGSFTEEEMANNIKFQAEVMEGKHTKLFMAWSSKSRFWVFFLGDGVL